MRRPGAAATPDAVFVVGAPRSGTTLLYKVLCLHDDSSWLSNYHARAPALPALDAVVRLVRGSHRRREAWFDTRSNAYVFGSPRAWRDRLVPAPVEADALWSRAFAAGRGGAAAARVNRLVRGARRYGGGHVVVGKRIGNNRHLAEVAAALPRARFVHVVRDGRDVAASLRLVDWWPGLRVWWLGRTPVQWEAGGGDPWVLAARHWVREVTSVQAGLALVPREQVLVVRYEDLVRDPVATLERVREFAGLPASASWQHEVGRLDIAPRRSERGPGPGDLERVVAEQRTLLDRLGYR